MTEINILFALMIYRTASSIPTLGRKLGRIPELFMFPPTMVELGWRFLILWR